mgnify:CR=1 FL=1
MESTVSKPRTPTVSPDWTTPDEDQSPTPQRATRCPSPSPSPSEQEAFSWFARQISCGQIVRLASQSLGAAQEPIFALAVICLLCSNHCFDLTYERHLELKLGTGLDLSMRFCSQIPAQTQQIACTAPTFQKLAERWTDACPQPAGLASCWVDHSQQPFQYHGSGWITEKNCRKLRKSIIHGCRWHPCPREDVDRR